MLNLGFGRRIDLSLIRDELYKEALRRGFIDLLDSANKNKLNTTQLTELTQAISIDRVKKHKRV